MHPQPIIKQSRLESDQQQIMYVKPKTCQALTLGLKGLSLHISLPSPPLPAARVRKPIKLFARASTTVASALGVDLRGLTGVATGFLSKRASLTGHTVKLVFHCLPITRYDAAGCASAEFWPLGPNPQNPAS